MGDEYESDDDNYQEKDNQYGHEDSCQGHYQGKAFFRAGRYGGSQTAGGGVKDGAADRFAAVNGQRYDYAQDYAYPGILRHKGGVFFKVLSSGGGCEY